MKTRTLLITIISSAALLGSARAATWTGGGADAKWSTAANWGGAAPFNGESLIFSVTNRFGGSNDFVGYTFQDITLTTNGFSIGGNAFTLNNGIANLNNNTISNNITLASPQTFASSFTATTLTLRGNITNAGYDLTFGGLAYLDTYGIISGGGQLIYNGGTGTSPAQLIVRGACTYAGGTSVNGTATTAGRLQIAATTARLGTGIVNLQTDGNAAGQSGQLWLNAALVITNDIYAAGIGCPESAGHLGMIRFTTAGCGVSNIVLTGNGRLFVNGATESGVVAGTITGQYGQPFNLDVNVNDSGKTAGAGTLTFNKDNTIGGNVTIGGGKLVLKTAGGLGGTPSLSLKGATLDVSATTGFTLPSQFVGNGTITGNVTVASSSLLTLGAIGTPATLTVTNSALTLNDAVTLNFDFSTNAAALGGGTNDLIVCSNLTVNGTVTLNPYFLNPASPVLNQPYTIIKYTGTYSGSGSFVLATGYGYTVNTAGGAVTVTFTALTPRNLTWYGAPVGDWDVNLTPDWTLTPSGTPTKFYTRDNVTFDDNGLAYSTINLPASLAPGTITFNNNGDYYLGTGYSGTGALAGASSLLKTGAGKLSINTTNTAYDGTITVSQGTLVPGNVSALGTTNGPTVVTNSGTLDVNALVLGFEPVIASGTGVNGLGALVNNNPAQQLNALRNVTLAGDLTVGGIQRFDIRATAGTNALLSTGGKPYNLTVAFDASNPSYFPVFALVSTYVDPALGNIDVQSGRFQFEANSTSLGNPASSLVVEPGAFLVFYNPTNRMNKAMTFRDTSVLTNQSGANTIVGPMTFESGMVNLGVGGTSLALAGPVTGSAALFKDGGGGLYFNGTNSNTGGLTVTNGAVGGVGLITGAAVVVTNATVSPGTNGVSTPGTFTVTSGLVLLTNSALTFDFTNNAAVGGGNDLISLSDGTTQGTLTLDGPITVNANPMAGNLVAGTYTLITNGSATLIPNAASIVPGNGLPIGARYGSPSFDLSTPGTLLMTIPTTGDKLVWKGIYSANWDTDAFSYSWSNAVTHADPDYFYNSDSVVFDDSASSYAVTVNAPVLPNSLELANNVNGYAFTSTVLATNRISGGTGLLQTGNGVNVMALNNDYTGGTVIQAGVLQLGHANALGNPQGVTPLAVITNRTAAGASLDINGFDLTGKIPTIYLSGPGVAANMGALMSSASGGATSGNGVRNITLTGNASIGQDGGNRMDLLRSGGVLNGNGFKLTKVGNNYTSLQPPAGAYVTNLVELDVNGGTIEAQVQVGTLAVVNASGTFESYNSPPFTNAFVLNGGRLFTGAGTFMSLGPVTLNAGSNSLDGTMIISNKISGPGLLSKLNNNTLTLAANNDWTGGLLIPTGTVNVGNGTNGTAGSGPITNNGTLNISRSSDLVWSNPVTGSGIWKKSGTNYTVTVLSTNLTSSASGGAIAIEGTVIISTNAYLGATNTASQFYTGNYTNGNIIINGGTMEGGGYMQVGRLSGSAVGTASTSSLTLNSGLVIHGTGSFLIAGDSGATGTITVNGGVISNTSVLYVGDTANGRGYLNLNGGRVQAPQISYRNQPVTASVVTFNGGILQAVASQANFLVVSNAWVSTNGLIFDTGATNVVTINQNLLAFTNLPASAPDAGLVKIGASTLTLTSQTNTYPGNTLVSNGTLVVNTRLTGGGALIVSPGATLSGTFTNLGPLTVNGTLSAGAVTPLPATLTVSNTVFGAGATNLVDLASPNTTPGAGINDLLVVNGNLDISNPSKVVFNFLNGIPAIGSPYTLITYSGTLAGTTANLQPVVVSPSNVSAFITNTANAIIATFSISNPRAPTNLVWTGDGLTNVWAVATNGDWRTASGGTPDVFYTMDNVLFDDSSTNRTVNLAGLVAPATTVVNTATNYSFTNNGSLGGPAQLVKQGPGTLVLTTTNSYGGGTLVTAGILQLSSNVANLGLPSAGVICQVTNGGALDINALDISVSTNYLYIAGGYSSNIGAVFTSRAIANGKGLKNIRLTANASIGNSTARIDDNGGVLDGGGFTLTKVGTQTLALWSAGGRATNLASVIIATNGGTLEMGNGGWYALNCPLFVNSNSAFNFYNLNANFTNTPVTLSFATWNNTGGNGTNAGTVTLTAGTTNYVTCSGGTSLNFLGPIVGPGSLQKNNTSALPVRLLTNNTYTGATIVNQGTLVIGATGSISNSPLILVNSAGTFDVSGVAGGFALASGQALAGSGSILGSVTAGNNLIEPGGLNAVGTLTNQNNLTVGAGATLYVDLTNAVTEGSGVNDLLLINGNATFSSSVTVNVYTFTGPPVLGVPYTIVRCVGTLTVDASTWTATGTRYPAVFSSTDGHTIQVTFSDIAPGSTSLVWQGDPAQNTNWAVGITGWVNPYGPTTFYNSDSVLFDDTAANLTAYLAGPVYPASVTVNATKNYTFAGTGNIAGAAGLTKTGTGTLTLANAGANTYTGPTTVGGGTLRIGSVANPVPASSAVVLSNAAGAVLDLNSLNLTINSLDGGGASGGNITLGTGALSINGGGSYGGVISGNGQLVKSGSGSVTLSGASTYTGGTVLNAGTVIVANSTGSGTGPGSVLIATSGGTLQIGTNSTVGSIAPQPGGVITNNGRISLNRSDALVINDQITGTGNIQQVGSGASYINGAISGSTLINQTAGLLYLTASNSYAGATTLNSTTGGVTVISHSYALGTTNGTTTINGNLTGNNILQLAGNITVPETFILSARQGGTVNIPHIESISGTNTLTGPLPATTGGSDYNLQADVGSKLIVAGTFNPPSAGGTRVLKLQGDGTGDWTGIIANGTDTTTLANVTKIGLGTWTLSGTNSYTGATAVNAGSLLVNGVIRGSGVNNTGGTLGGTGLISAPVTIASGATLAPGTSVGTLTISNTLTLADGSTTAIEIDKTAGTYDRVRGLSTVTLGGTLSVASLAAPLAAGDSFKLFDATSYTGAFASITPAAPGAGLGWDTNSLAVDGTLKVISVAGPQISTVFMSGANFVFSGSNGVPNATYNVLASTNVVTPLSQWIQVGTSTFGPDGSFSYTNIGSALEAQFFMLKVP